MGDALCQVRMMTRKKMDVTKLLLPLIYPLHEKADGAGAGAPRQKPLSLTHSLTLPCYCFTDRERDGMGDVFFLETRSPSPSLDFGVMRAYHLSLSLSGKGEHYLLYCGGIKFMTTKTPFLPSEKAVFDV